MTLKGIRNGTCVCLLLLAITLSNSILTINFVRAENCLNNACGQVSLSPGQFDGTLSTNVNTVKLTYPNSTILTGSIGDLLFTLTLFVNPNIPCQASVDFCTRFPPSTTTRYKSIDIYIPPDFTGISESNIWTSFTNDYSSSSITVFRRQNFDTIAPQWLRISILNITVTTNPALLTLKESFTHTRVFLAGKPQYVRIFNAIAPRIAGRYFFKVFINWGTHSDDPSASIGPKNFPTIVVVGSRDPAYISGTLRDAGNLNPTQYGKPIALRQGYGAHILARGIDTTGRRVSAQVFINSTSNGNYTIFGLAAGTYNITAYAAGFFPTRLNGTVAVHPDQGLTGIDIYMPHSTNVTGTVLSVAQDNRPVPWGFMCGFRGSGTNVLSLLHNTSDVCGHAFFPIARSVLVGLVALNGSLVAETVPSSLQRSHFLHTSLFANPTSSTISFSILDNAMFDGRVPQNNATYTSGVRQGDYVFSVNVTSYISLNFYDVYEHVTNITTRTFSFLRLVRSSFFNVTVHFKDYATTLSDIPTSFAGTLNIYAYDQRGILRGTNVTSTLPKGLSRVSIEVMGFSETRNFGFSNILPKDYGLNPGTYHILVRYISSPFFTGFANLGITDLYYQVADFQATLILPSSVSYNQSIAVSLAMVKAAQMNLTIYSVDNEVPPVLIPWQFPRAAIVFKIIDRRTGTTLTVNSTQPLSQKPKPVTFSLLGLVTDPYDVYVQTVGYSQSGNNQPFHVQMVLGNRVNASIWMIEDPRAYVIMVFRTEDLFTAIDSTLPYAQPLNSLDATPIRAQVYDQRGNFVGANVTYVHNKMGKQPRTSFNITLVGFENYYGDPMRLWAGFYDTTDGVRQSEGGLLPGSYTIVIWLDGYYSNPAIVHVTLLPRQRVTTIITMDRASRIHGQVLGPTLYYRAVFLSWANITLQSDFRSQNYTTPTLDGIYQIWVPAGTYHMGVSMNGYAPKTTTVSVPEGSNLEMDFYLLDYGLSYARTPEFPVALALVMVFTLALSSYALKAYRRRIRSAVYGYG